MANKHLTEMTPYVVVGNAKAARRTLTLTAMAAVHRPRKSDTQRERTSRMWHLSGFKTA